MENYYQFPNSYNDQLEQIKSILLAEERNAMGEVSEKVRELLDNIDDIQQKIGTVDTQVNELLADWSNPNTFEARISPHVDAKIAQLRSKFQQYFGPQVKETVKHEITNSKDEFIETLYPMMGKMVSKYVRQQLEVAIETTTERVGNIFSFLWWKNQFLGRKPAEMIAEGRFPVRIEEVFIIQQQSGLLLGTYSKNNTLDLDMIGGMLTAIKGFHASVQNVDSMNGEAASLEAIEYADKKILITDLPKYYTAVVVDGVVSPVVKVKLRDYVLDFCDKYVGDTTSDSVDNEEYEYISDRLKSYFQDISLQ